MKIQLTDHFDYRRLLRFSLPTIIMIICTSIYCIVDGFFVSNVVGKTAFASINLIMPVLIGVGSIGLMFGTGGSAMIAKLMGQKKTGRSPELLFHVGLYGHYNRNLCFFHRFYFYPPYRCYLRRKRRNAGILCNLWAYFILFHARLYSAIYVPKPVRHGRKAQTRFKSQYIGRHHKHPARCTVHRRLPMGCGRRRNSNCTWGNCRRASMETEPVQKPMSQKTRRRFSSNACRVSRRMGALVIMRARPSRCANSSSGMPKGRTGKSGACTLPCREFVRHCPGWLSSSRQLGCSKSPATASRGVIRRMRSFSGLPRCSPMYSV